MDRTAERTDLLRQLGEQAERLTESAEWQRWLDVASRFHHYSLNNQLLIMTQRPDATQVAGYKTWQSLGRQVAKGQHGIRILAPTGGPCRGCNGTGHHSADHSLTCGRCGGSGPWQSFTIVSVFDIASTEGEPLPEHEWPLLVDMPDERLWDHLAAVCESLGLRLATTSESTNGARGWYRPSDRSVTIVDSYPLASQARTLLHELAHSIDPGCDGEESTRAERELVAESVAYFVGKRLGLDMDACSAFYVASWHGNVAALGEIAHRVLTLAEQLEAAVTAAAGREAVAA
jgi:hypothetical protein